MRVVILTLVFVAAAYVYQQQGQPTRSEGELLTTLVAGPSRLTTTAGPVMVEDTLEGYRSWSRRPEHFGAFAMSEFGYYGHARGFNELNAAEKVAMAHCDQPDCRVVARMIPLNPVEDTGVLIVSQRAVDVFEDYLPLGGIKAMAIHPGGAAGSWINDVSFASAYDGAIAECERWHDSNPTPEAADLGGCRVVHATR